MRILIALAAFAVMIPDATQARDTQWGVVENKTSAVDGKRTFIVAARRADVYLAVGCELIDGPIVNVALASPGNIRAGKTEGAYRLDDAAPVSVTWDASGPEGGALYGEAARVLIPALMRARTWHIRIGGEERSLNVEGAHAMVAAVVSACALSPPR